MIGAPATPPTRVTHPMPGFLRSLLDDYQVEMERHRNRPFLEAAMAACALAACAGGTVTLGQRIRIDQILETLERLRVFDPHEGVEIFNRFTSAIHAAPKAGQHAAAQALAPYTSDPEAASLLVRICLAVAEADGDKSLSQHIQVVMLCGLLGVDPGPLGFYADPGREDCLPADG